MDAFLVKFEKYALLADYNDTRQIELLEQNTDKEIVSRLILEKGHYTSIRMHWQTIRPLGGGELTE